MAENGVGKRNQSHDDQSESGGAPRGFQYAQHHDDAVRHLFAAQLVDARHHVLDIRQIPDDIQSAQKTCNGKRRVQQQEELRFLLRIPAVFPYRRTPEKQDDKDYSDMACPYHHRIQKKNPQRGGQLEETQCE